MALSKLYPTNCGLGGGAVGPVVVGCLVGLGARSVTAFEVAARSVTAFEVAESFLLGLDL